MSDSNTRKTVTSLEDQGLRIRHLCLT